MARKTLLTSEQKARAKGLRALRCQARLPSTALALICGCSREKLQTYERALVPLTPARLNPILAAFRAHIETQQKALAEFETSLLTDPDFYAQYRAQLHAETASNQKPTCK